MSRYGNEFDEPIGNGPSIQARLKWFNTTKGFGFVSPFDGSADAFLHVSVLHRAGLQQIGDDAELLVELGPGPKGPQVLRIIEVTNPGTSSHGGGGSGFSEPRQSRLRDSYQDHYVPSAHEQEFSGTVKWFKGDKGFGFITPDNSDKDIFVHKTVLQRSGLQMLEAGQRVQLRAQEVDKGREATWVTLL